MTTNPERATLLPGYKLRFNPVPLVLDPIPAFIAGIIRPHLTAGNVTIALSGGTDSMVMLHACHLIQQASSGKNASKSAPVLDFDAIHVHHGLSPNADKWADFCQAECDKRGIPLKIIRVSVDRNNTDGQGVEGAARAARYLAFAEHGASLILAAQHQDDQAETVLHQLLRGTGLNGLAGMGFARMLAGGQLLLRPLLYTSRAEIEAYAAEHSINHIHDESNDDTAYTRNFIRHDVMPVLLQRFPHARESLARAASHAAEAAHLNEALAKIDLRWDGERAYAAALDDCEITRQTNALYYFLRWHNIPAPSHAQIAEWARQLFRASPMDKPHQAGGHDFVIRRSRGMLSLKLAEN
jgi:tRNA(Ile)-lysidine synthase